MSLWFSSELARGSPQKAESFLMFLIVQSPVEQEPWNSFWIKRGAVQTLCPILSNVTLPLWLTSVPVKSGLALIANIAG
jgi:hypothetical protein